ncbi:hypothetical protein HOLleu_28995 [Holothuria leucospilota]|uniref:Uncharacterized protein n=1 Tax=Holothuria leucospilota TaxID=206669 RepID=A0A9Q1H1W5_HOLLE|nr:hypothetical protein HOLleu_28995 [Holothuria leucospilota]
MAVWVDTTASSTIPPTAWVAGKEEDGTPYYVVRGNNPDDPCYRMAGKFHPNSDGAYMANWTKVCKAKEFQILTLSSESNIALIWLTIDKNTCAPPNSFIVMPDHHFCIARAEVGNSWYPGVVNVDNNVCHVCINEGNETKLVKLDDWQVLVEEPINGAKWVETIGNKIPEHAWQAGHESDGKPLFLAYNTSVGKLGPHMNRASVAHNGYTLEFDYSWVLTLPPDAKVTLKWVNVKKKEDIPSNACKITTTAYLSPDAVRIARAEHKNGMQPGIYYNKDNYCLIPVQKNEKGKATKKKSFQILTVEPL